MDARLRAPSRVHRARHADSRITERIIERDLWHGVVVVDVEETSLGHSRGRGTGVETDGGVAARRNLRDRRRQRRGEIGELLIRHGGDRRSGVFATEGRDFVKDLLRSIHTVDRFTLAQPARETHVGCELPG